MGSQSKAPPIIDFGPFYSNDESCKQKLVHEVRDACREFGFFQIINHGISADLQKAIFEQSADFFSAPVEEKLKYDKDLLPFNRGYERFRAQNFEKKPESKGDLKEGYFFALDMPADHPSVIARKFGQAPNLYPGPSAVTDAKLFKETIDQYHRAATGLSEDLLRVVAMTIDLEEDWFDKSGYTDSPAAILRLTHYPPQAPDASEHERGIGAHTDFGGITILLQDSVGGLQVWDRESQWIDITPTPGALVVNLGNLMMRWTNDRYLSNLHRVINKSGKERYSIPFFFAGNPDFLVECLPNCAGEEGPKYSPVTVGDWILGRFADTYGNSNAKAYGDLSKFKASN